MPSVRRKILKEDALYWTPLVRNQFAGGGTVQSGDPTLVKSRWHSMFAGREDENRADVTVGFDAENSGFIMKGGWLSLNQVMADSSITTLAKYLFDGNTQDDDNPGGDLDLTVGSGAVSFSAGVDGQAMFTNADVTSLSTAGNAGWGDPDRFGLSAYVQMASTDAGVSLSLTVGGVSISMSDTLVDIGGTQFTMQSGWASSFVQIHVQMINGVRAAFFVGGQPQTPTTSVSLSAPATASPVAVSFDRNGTSDVIGIDRLFIASEFAVKFNPNDYIGGLEVLHTEMANAIRGSWDGRVRHLKLKRGR